MPDIPHAALCIRVSAEGQAMHGLLLSAQRDFLTRCGQNHLKHPIAREYISNHPIRKRPRHSCENTSPMAP